MIDFHCHILPGLDDGPAHIDESVAMAAVLRDAGFRTIYCTPHLMKGVYEASNEEVHASLDALQASLNKENIGLQLFPGREHYLDEFLFDYLKKPMPLGNTNLIMLEIPGNISPEFIKETCFRITCSGFIPMIAHPERCNFSTMLQKQMKTRLHFFKAERTTEKSELSTYLTDLGCAFQGNLGSFIGLYGSEAQKIANSLKKMEVYTHFGTDAHSLQTMTLLNLSSVGAKYGEFSRGVGSGHK
jgi:protein-tyrosine phosphatase